MRLAVVAIACLTLGLVSGGWAGRELFGHDLFVSVDLAPGTLLGVVADNNTDALTRVASSDEELDFETPCVSRQLKREVPESYDYQELLSRLPKDHKTTFEDSRAVSVWFDCRGLSYHLQIGRDGRIHSISVSN